MSESRIYLSTSLIVLLLVLSNPVNAFLPSDVVYSQIESVTYEKSEYRDNVTHFKFIIKGQIINTSEDNVTIITPITDLYIARVTNLDQGTRGDSPSSMLPKKTNHILHPGVHNYSVNVTLGINGDYDVLPDGNYTFHFIIPGGYTNNNTSFNAIPHLIVYQNGIIIHSENIITFNTQMPQTPITNTIASNSEQIVASSESILIDPLPISSSYLLFLLLPIFSIFKSRFKVKTRR